MKKIFKISYAILVCLTLVMTGCSDSDYDSSGIANTKLSGKISGTSFSAKGGQSFTAGDGNIYVHITNISADCNSDVLNYEFDVSALIKPELGIYTDVFVALTKKGNTPVNILGTVEVVKFLNNELTVKIKANSSVDNYVEGFFTVPFCEQ
ncbi:hypothetical protein [Tenacibaculum caenipelagi]|uniref:Lipocalin-like domain-containing protein n=1 Tax=Tenacibaculum caenipelagi TaxID=1325435 RepID=A0A4R6TFX0_9FLAO|nr:hypothetical protein [Tenacibaculum caenipelagi]TDQ28908.1 hypothetical protein DFQ07_1289 [Tenacibaculum caenipelagi]